MDRQATSGWQRRDFLGGAALLALALGVPVAAVRLSDLRAEDAPSDRQRALLCGVSQLVIPRTDTPGAGDVGSGDFVLLALAHGLEGSRKPVSGDAARTSLRHLRADGSLDHAAWLESALDQRAKGDFMALPEPSRAAALTALDAEAFAPDAAPSPWKVIKALILTGYYTSEAGGAKELRYELVPGRYDPDVPATPETRAFSSDWTAVDFG
jgi:hypothetical protein